MLVEKEETTIIERGKEITMKYDSIHGFEGDIDVSRKLRDLPNSNGEVNGLDGCGKLEEIIILDQKRRRMEVGLSNNIDLPIGLESSSNKDDLGLSKNIEMAGFGKQTCCAQ